MLTYLRMRRIVLVYRRNTGSKHVVSRQCRVFESNDCSACRLMMMMMVVVMVTSLVLGSRRTLLVKLENVRASLVLIQTG